MIRSLNNMNINQPFNESSDIDNRIVNPGSKKQQKTVVYHSLISGVVLDIVTLILALLLLFNPNTSMDVALAFTWYLILVAIPIGVVTIVKLRVCVAKAQSKLTPMESWMSVAVVILGLFPIFLMLMIWNYNFMSH